MLLFMFSSVTGAYLLTMVYLCFLFQQGDRQLWFASKQSLTYLDGT
jgi:hypothetical protein